MQKGNKAKDYMLQYKKATEKVEKLKSEIKDLMGMLTDIGGFDYSKDRVLSSTNPNAPYVTKLEIVDAKERELEKAVEDKKESLKKVGAVVNQVKNDRSRIILQKLYMQLLDWNDIFEHGKLSESTYYAWHKEALDEVTKIIGVHDEKM